MNLVEDTGRIVREPDWESLFSDVLEVAAAREHWRRVDKADRETVFDIPEVWTKALPALGVTFPLENIEGRVNTAKQLLSTALSVKRLYFGNPIGSTEFWIAEEAWSAVQGAVDEAEMKGFRC